MSAKKASGKRAKPMTIPKGEAVKVRKMWGKQTVYRAAMDVGYARTYLDQYQTGLPLYPWDKSEFPRIMRSLTELQTLLMGAYHGAEVEG